MPSGDVGAPPLTGTPAFVGGFRCGHDDGVNRDLRDWRAASPYTSETRSRQLADRSVTKARTTWSG